jgi:hypothetical protein
MGKERDQHYVLYDDAVHIADTFWKAFGAQLSDASAIQSAMQIGAALSTSVGRRYIAGYFGTFPVMLDYNIPAFWSSA